MRGQLQLQPGTPRTCCARVRQAERDAAAARALLSTYLAKIQNMREPPRPMEAAATLDNLARGLRVAAADDARAAARRLANFIFCGRASVAEAEAAIEVACVPPDLARARDAHARAREIAVEYHWPDLQGDEDQVFTAEIARADFFHEFCKKIPDLMPSLFLRGQAGLWPGLLYSCRRAAARDAPLADTIRALVDEQDILTPCALREFEREHKLAALRATSPRQREFAREVRARYLFRSQLNNPRDASVAGAVRALKSAAAILDSYLRYL